MRRLRRSITRTFLAGTLTIIGVSGCSRRALSVLVDVPEEEAKPQAVQVDSTILRALADSLRALQELAGFQHDTVRPEIEKFLDPDTVVALLPRDNAGNIDWMQALRDSVIRPRAYIPGERPPPRPDGFQFAFDFYFPGPNQVTDAFFPHSSHTQWLDCRQCHSRIFRYRGTKIQMADIFQGKYCAECHGKVAYPVMTACERCHTGMSMPPNRATPELLGTLRLRPAVEILAEAGTADSTKLEGINKGVASRMGLPPAQFPHWVHRIRFRCKVCHMDIFEPRNGANAVTMRDISEGRYCGRCHNGKVAFAAGFGECQRCHVAPEGGE
ncbi:MAG: hypothetical protein D6701_06810 [Gemmatimonadetes bacterium]|nr:MAG: hypothetical protein D6701_06810 [Gemmatimonadota bacterium]